MPESTQDILWWAFNGAIAVILWFARNDLKEIKTDIKSAQAAQTKNTLDIAQIQAKCPKWGAHYHRRANDNPDDDC